VPPEHPARPSHDHSQIRIHTHKTSRLPQP
jgi:hypothetical protein